MEIFIQRVKTIIVLILRSIPFLLCVIALPFFSCALLVTSCCCLYHLSADDETSNVLKRSVKNVRSRFGFLLYTKLNIFLEKSNLQQFLTKQFS